MITLTIVENKTEKGKKIQTKEIKLFNSLDKAKAYASPIANNMKFCRKLKQTPKTEIVAVSYDSEYEKQMLLQIGAIITNDNEPID